MTRFAQVWTEEPVFAIKPGRFKDAYAIKTEKLPMEFCISLQHTRREEKITNS